MLEIRGKYCTAKVFTDTVEAEAIRQILQLCNQDFVSGSKVRIMPDVHAGKGCVIGFTANLGDKVIPNLVGVDLGCGMYVAELGETDIDLVKLDETIRRYIPAGVEVHEGRIVKFPELQQLYCYRDLKDTGRIERSLGTLGGGNHFIECNQDKHGDSYLVIHSGSRNLGKQVADIYQKLAVTNCSEGENYLLEREAIIQGYKRQGKKDQIQKALKQLRDKYNCMAPKYNSDFCYLTGDFREKYLHDMEICQRYAALNREIMAGIVSDKMSLPIKNSFHTVHNYIDFNDNIIRKGSVAAYKDQKIIIPINMRDGSILAVGKGNEDWNNSAPHGAGRLMSRSRAKEILDLELYKETMKDIYSTSVCLSTLDEAPMAYKPIMEIVENIVDTVDIIDIIKPIYNFKSK